MIDLTTWLRAQLDEDERVAREASGDTWVVGTSKGYRYSHPGDVYAIAHDGTPARIAQGTACGPDISAEQSSAHIARHNPVRVLAEVEAKRRILDLHQIVSKPEVNLVKQKPISDTWDGDLRITKWGPHEPPVLVETGTLIHACINCDQGAELYFSPQEGCATVRLLALPYADHEGYREEWRP